MANIDLYQILSALSLAIDLAECSTMCDYNVMESVTDIDYRKHKFLNHSKRTSYVAVRIAQQISRDEEFIKNVYIASSLHDIGASGIMDASHVEEDFIYQHSLSGSALAEKLPFGKEISDFIRFHHENYDGSARFGLKGGDIPLISQIIRLCDTFEMIYDESKPNYVQRNDIINWILSRCGTVFNPSIVDAFMDIQSREVFWWDVENLGSIPDIFERIRPKVYASIQLSDMKNIAVIFSDIIDRKSPFTYQHSSNLAKMTVKISDYLGFDHEKKAEFEIAALLHDIGKLAVPNSILDKSGKLDNREFTVIKSHTYYTRVVLSKIKGFEHITNWAANHHEKLNAKGYPLGLSGDFLSIEERIMTVCDMFEALTANRPYRKGLSKDESLRIIEGAAENGDICCRALDILKEII